MDYGSAVNGLGICCSPALIYAVLSLGVYTLFYPWGFLTGQQFPEPYLSSEIRFFFESVIIIIGIEWYLYRYRNLFGIGKTKDIQPESSDTVSEKEQL